MIGNLWERSGYDRISRGGRILSAIQGPRAGRRIQYQPRGAQDTQMSGGTKDSEAVAEMHRRLSQECAGRSHSATLFVQSRAGFHARGMISEILTDWTLGPGGR